MQKFRYLLTDALFTIGTLLGVFLVNLFLVEQFATKTMTPMIFVLGVFLVSWRTQGYVWGIAASLVSVLAVNWAFTYPYWAFDLISPECISSAVVMLIVAVMTGALTTRLKQQEKLKAEAQAERMRGNLLRAVSHDLRTPLTTIYGSATALLEEEHMLTETQKQTMLRGIREDSEWLVRMVENLLSITRIDSGNVKISKTPTVLEELIDSCVLKFKKRYPDQFLELEIPDEIALIPMDAILIEQVIVNILDNAVQHARGMTRLTLRVFLLGGQAIFEIKDNGCGIHEDMLGRIFTGYEDSRNHPADSRKRNFGIGLSVCATIIAAHGGDIRAENNKSGGATFRFTLSMEDTEHEQ